ncbi:MAG: YezD family protein [Chitinispirillaceae bacterium]|nr:YezD family protein [Chitinispirillaceae bacterium]
MEKSNDTIQLTQVDSRTQKEIIDSIKSVSYGEVVITVHDKRVVQIEKKEKKRL